MKITFKDLMRISEGFDVEDDEYFIEFINKFDGDDIFEKFKNILNTWERDVSYEISLGTSEKSFSLQLSYFISEINEIEKDPIIISEFDDLLVIELNTPENFSNSDDVFPIYDLIKKIVYKDQEYSSKDVVVDELPADIFNKIMKRVGGCKGKTVEFENRNLKDMKLNFLTNEPYYFLRNLFNPYSKDYYRDIIYYLSSRITGNILLDSTMMDIEYYVKKMEEENKQESKQQIS